MKKLLSFVTLIALTGTSVPYFAYAQSGATGTIQAYLELIANLQKQIQILQEQIVQLRQKQDQNVSELLSILKEGSKGDKVKTLQALLAADPEIYPEGLITGSYGKLTAKAVKKFQKRHGLEQVGFVGPKTLKKLNELLQEHPLTFEEADDQRDDTKKDGKKVVIIGASGATVSLPQGEARLCAIVPPGHLIAPGWLRKQGGVRPIVPLCQVLPPGIVKQLPPASTSTPDTIAPTLSGITATPSTTSAVVTWLTNEPADSEVLYGTSTSYGLAASNPTLVTSHILTLSGLTSSTTYHFQIKSRDAAGNAATSSDQAFTTSAVSLADTTSPLISGIAIAPTSTSAIISWLTNEPADSQVSYGTSTAYGFNTTLDTVLVTSHLQTIAGLVPSTTYHVQLRSKDSSANLATSTDQIFTTTAAPDTTPPVLSGISVTPSSTSAFILWTTDEAATSKVYYSTSTPVNLGTANATSDATLALSHNVNLVGLNASSTYYSVVESQDAAGNTATSTEQSFTTSP